MEKKIKKEILAFNSLKKGNYLEAENLLREQGFKTGHNKSMIDDTSAAIILQEYIDSK